MYKPLTLILTLFIASAAFAQQRTRPVTPPPPAPAPTPAPTPPPPPPPALTGLAGDPLPGLTQAQLRAFNDGRREFTDVESVADGLGPVFNGRSCAECHGAPAVGGLSPRQVTRIGSRVSGTFDPLTRVGGSLMQDRAIGPQDGSTHPFRPERPGPLALIVVHRRTTSLFGLGLVDATPDADFVALAAQQRARSDGTAGRVSMVDNISAGMKTVGKFGWKAQVPTLLQFSGDAYLNEMGITNPLFPDENCPNGDCTELRFNPAPGLNEAMDGVQSIADFMMMLAPPTRGAITADVTDGEAVFSRIGCNSCHIATLQSGSSPIAALNRQTYHPYSDFLLHDVGALGDDIEQGAATGREIRTAPLWGLRFENQFLHDGRARSIDDAIALHDGQARASRDRFNALSPIDRTKLLAFLRSL